MILGMFLTVLLKLIIHLLTHKIVLLVWSLTKAYTNSNEVNWLFLLCKFFVPYRRVTTYWNDKAHEIKYIK